MLNNMSQSFFGPSNLVDLVRYRASIQPDDLAFVYLTDGVSSEIPLTYGELDRRCRSLAAWLQRNGMRGKRALLLYPPALAEAIKEGRIGGLGVDVYSVEPFPENHPYTEILGFDNVLFTPHMAWGSYEARNRCVRIMGENIKSFFGGENKNRIV